MIIRSRWPSVALIILISLFFAAAQCLFSLSTRSSNGPYYEIDNNQLLYDRTSTTCGYTGNSDIYGLGIRIGIYLQWFSTWLSTAFIPEEMLGTTVANSIFLIAISAATLSLCTSSPTAGGTPVYTADLIILLAIFGISVYFLYSLSWFGRHFGPSSSINFTFEDSTALGESIKMILSLSMASVSIWFWFHGVDQFTPTPCGTYAFLFGARINATGRAARVVYGLASCFALFVFAWFGGAVVMLVTAFPATGFYLLMYKHKKIKDVLKFWRVFLMPWILDNMNSFTEYARANRQVSKRKVHIFRWTMAAFDLFIFSLAIASIEMTIIWNSITSVYTVSTTGQVIPLIIGIGGVLKILWSGLLDPLRKWTEMKDDNFRDEKDDGKISIASLIPETYNPSRKIHRLNPAYRDRHPKNRPRPRVAYKDLPKRWPTPHFAKRNVARRQSLDSIHVPGFEPQMTMTATRRSKDFFASKFKIQVVFELENEKQSEEKTFIGRTGLFPQIKKWLQEEEKRTTESSHKQVGKTATEDTGQT